MNWEVVKVWKYKTRPIWLDYDEYDIIDIGLDALIKEETKILNEAQKNNDEEGIEINCQIIDMIEELQSKIKKAKNKYENHD